MRCSFLGEISEGGLWFHHMRRVFQYFCLFVCITQHASAACCLILLASVRVYKALSRGHVKITARWTVVHFLFRPFLAINA